MELKVGDLITCEDGNVDNAAFGLLLQIRQYNGPPFGVIKWFYNPWRIGGELYLTYLRKLS